MHTLNVHAMSVGIPIQSVWVVWGTKLMRSQLSNRRFPVSLISNIFLLRGELQNDALYKGDASKTVSFSINQHSPVATVGRPRRLEATGINQYES